MLTLHEIAGNANDEELAKPLVEDDLRRDPRVGAHDDGGIGVLTGCQLLPNVRAAIPHQVAEASSGVKLIPLQQEGEGIVGADRFLLCRIGGQRRGGDGEGNKGSQKQAFSSLHISPPISLYVRYRARSLARLAASLPPARGPRLRSRGRGLRPAEQYEVVAVDHLVAALGERALGARVEVEVTRGVERVGDPVLAVREAVTV